MTDLTQLDEQRAQSSLSALDIFLIVLENVRLLIVVPVIAAIAGYMLSYVVPPTYTATTRVLPPQQPSSSATALLANQLGAITGLAGSSLGLKSPADIYVAMLTSRTIADRIVERFELKKVYSKDLMDDVRKELASRTKATATRDGLIVVDVDDRSPQRAAEMANAFVEELRKLSQSIAVTEAGQRRVFFEEQLRLTDRNLRKAEIALRESGISEATIKALPQSAVEAVARLKAQIAAQEVRLAALRGFMTDSNPEYRRALQELAALRQQLTKAAQVDADIASSAGAEYLARYREFKYHEALFELMAKQYELARLDEAREGAVIQVVDYAVAPERKSRPKGILVALISFIAAFIFALLVVIVRQIAQALPNDPVTNQKRQRLSSLLRLRRQG